MCVRLNAGWKCLAGVLALGFSLLAATAAEEIKNSSCLDCHDDPTMTKTNAAGRVITLFADKAKLAASSHATNSCVSCHSDLTAKHPDDNVPVKAVDCAKCHVPQSQSYGASVHALALRKGELAAPTCSDCHDGHSILPPSSPESPLHYTNLGKTCGQCHVEESKEVAESVHGQALAAGKRDAPTCTDCHSEHNIQGLKTASSLTISQETCGRCHASERLNTKYNLPADRVKTFFESYHGLAGQYGSTLAANCASCHGVHRILRSSDPRSTINPNHLVETCGKCHPGTTTGFALGKIHVDAGTATAGVGVGEKVNWWVRRLYLGLIFAVIGGMLVHNGLLLARRLAAVNRARDRSVIRMNLSQRVQHALLVTSFVVLAITGFALKFPDSWLARALGSSEPFRRWTHRVAGVVLLVLGAYHISYVMFTKEGRQLVRDFFPRLQDVRDVLGNARYLAGFRADKPKIGRFGYAEKMEYWAVVWGTIIMGATGFAIWFKLDVTRFLPRWAVDVALTIHYYEAILACLAIVVWHFYHVIFDPEVYPLNWACWDGRVSKHWQQTEHPLEKPVLAGELKGPPPPSNAPAVVPPGS